VTSGISIVGSGSDADFPAVSIGVGSFTVSQSTNHPVGTAANYVKTTVAKTIGVFSIKAIGEDIVISEVKLQFDGTPNLSATNTLVSVGLYDGDTLLSDLRDIDNETDQTFSLSWTVPANTTKDLSVKAVTQYTSGNPTISVIWKDGNGYGLSSGEQISYTPDVTLSGITVYSAGQISTFVLDDTKTPYNQGVLSPLTAVSLGAFKVRVTREDMKLLSLELKAWTSSTPATTSGAVTSSAVSEVALYDTDGTQLTNYVSVNSAAGTFSIGSDDLLQDVVFTKDTYKTLVVSVFSKDHIL
jgi:hypothetical protein